MTQVNLRRNYTQKLTIAQADESLEHLSTYQPMTSAGTLHTGGKYRSEGTHALTMPGDGNHVTVWVVSGTPTLVGLVDGVTNPVLQPGGVREYAKVDAEWRLLSGGETSGGLGNFKSYTASARAEVANPLLWFDTAADAVCTLPSGLALDTTFGVVRSGAGGLTVRSENGVAVITRGVIDVTGSSINERGRFAWFKMGATHWILAT